MQEDCILIPLSQGKYAIIDAVDFPLVANRRWCAVKTKTGGFYASCQQNGRSIYMHRLILKTPAGQTPDHINRNGLDNRRSNLRPATQSQQNANTRTSSSNTSGYRGVSWDKERGKWEAHIQVSGKKRRLGRFDTAEEAAQIRDEAAREIFREFAALNFPKD